ncbi:kinesin-like protein KIN-14C, partial [Tanacetum coccineum]
ICPTHLSYSDPPSHYLLLGFSSTKSKRKRTHLFIDVHNPKTGDDRSSYESFEGITYLEGECDSILVSKRDFQLLQPEKLINDTIGDEEDGDQEDGDKDVDEDGANYEEKNRPADDAPSDKRRKLGSGRIMASTTSSRGRQALASVTTNQKEVAAAPSEAQVPEDQIMEFTKEEVDALLNERFKGKKFDSKGKQDWMTDYLKRLKTCIKWSQKSSEDLATDKDNLSNMLDSSKRNSAEAEAAMKKKEEDLNATICKLEANIASLKASLANEMHLIATNEKKKLELYPKKNQNSLKEELTRVENEASGYKEKVKIHEDMYKRLQEYNTSLQQYNTKLQNDLKSATDSNLQVEREKAVILENHSTLRGHYNMLQTEFTSAKDSRDEAFKQREAAVKEVGILRGELQRERTVNVYKLSIKSSALEETCSYQRDQISILQHQLAAANQKLKMADLSSSEIRTEYEDQKRIIVDLQDRLREAENQLLDGEKLRKKLHNTILELKGNIRVFCRVRPLLPDDGTGAEPRVTYPTFAELAGQGIDLIQSGQKYPFTFDKVFAHVMRLNKMMKGLETHSHTSMFCCLHPNKAATHQINTKDYIFFVTNSQHDVSQQDVFQEISQLVQSALDGYKTLHPLVNLYAHCDLLQE